MTVFDVMNREVERIRNIIRNKEEQEWNKRFKNAHIQKSELIEINVNLSSQIKHLKDLQADQDKEVERLRKLLKECLIYIPYSYPQFQTEKRIDLESAKLNLITRINTAIDESEE